MKHSKVWAGLLALLFAGGLTIGQTCPFTITHDADSMGVTCTEVSTGVWDLSLSITDTGYPVVTIIVNDLPGGISPAIRDLLVTINNPGGSGPTVALDLMGPFGDEDNLASLGTLTFATTTGGQLILREVYVGGDVGYIDTHAIGSLVIEGGSHRGHRYPSH